MYEYLKGVVTFVSPYYIVLEVGGVGYQLSVANPFQYSPFYQQEALVYVHQVIREDAHTLYGFKNLEEKQLFLRLIKVSGIGPKSALAILASEDHGGLVNAIESGDDEYLAKFPKVGKKTAQRMVVELKGKLGDLATTPEAVAAMKEQEKNAVKTNNQALAEALEALSALGYSEKEVKKAQKELEKVGETSTDEYLRQGLKLLMKK